MTKNATAHSHERDLTGERNVVPDSPPPGGERRRPTLAVWLLAVWSLILTIALVITFVKLSEQQEAQGILPSQLKLLHAEVSSLKADNVVLKADVAALSADMKLLKAAFQMTCDDIECVRKAEHAGCAWGKCIQSTYCDYPDDCTAAP